MCLQITFLSNYDIDQHRNWIYCRAFQVPNQATYPNTGKKKLMVEKIEKILVIQRTASILFADIKR